MFSNKVRRLSGVFLWLSASSAIAQQAWEIRNSVGALSATRPELRTELSPLHRSLVVVDLNGGQLLAGDAVQIQSPDRLQVVSVGAQAGARPVFAFPWSAAATTFTVKRADGASGSVAGVPVRFEVGSLRLRASGGLVVLSSLSDGPSSWVLTATTPPIGTAPLWPPVLDGPDEPTRLLSAVVVHSQHSATVVMRTQGLLLHQGPVSAGKNRIELPPLPSGVHAITAELVRSNDGLVSSPSQPWLARVDPTPLPPTIKWPPAALPFHGPLTHVRGFADAPWVEIWTENTLLARVQTVGGEFDAALEPPPSRPGYHLLRAVALLHPDDKDHVSMEHPHSILLEDHTLPVPELEVPRPYEVLGTRVAFAGKVKRGWRLKAYVDSKETSILLNPNGEFTGVVDVAPGNHTVRVCSHREDLGEGPCVASKFKATDHDSVKIDAPQLGRLESKEGGAVRTHVSGWEQSITKYTLRADVPDARAGAVAVAVVRETFNRDITKPYGEELAFLVLTERPGDSQYLAAEVPYLGHSHEGKLPHRNVVVDRTVRLEGGYIQQDKCAGADIASELAAEVPSVARALSRIAPSVLPGPYLALRYCRRALTGDTPHGRVVLVRGEEGAPEGVYSEATRAAEELTDFVNSVVAASGDTSLALTPAASTSSVSQGLGLECNDDCQLLLARLAHFPPLADLRTIRETGQFGDLSRCKTFPNQEECLMEDGACSVPAACEVVGSFSGPQLPEVCTGVSCSSWDLRTCTSTGCFTPNPLTMLKVRCSNSTAPSCSLTCVPFRQKPDCTAKNPVNTGYRPEHFADTQDGRSALKKLAEQYETMMWRHFVDGQYVRPEFDPTAAVDPETQLPTVFVQYHNQRNATGDTARAAVAIAHKVKVTGDPGDRENLVRLMRYLHTTMTLASEPIDGDELAPRGFVIDPQKVCIVGPRSVASEALNACMNSELSELSSPPPEGLDALTSDVCSFSRARGVWIRSLALGWNEDEMRPQQSRAFRQSQDEHDTETNGTRPTMYGYQADEDDHILLGLHPNVALAGNISPPHSPTHPRIRLLTANSRDNIGMVMWAVAHGFDELPDSVTVGASMVDLKNSIRLAVVEFGREFVRNNFTFLDIDGKVAPFSRMVPPVPADGGDPTNVLEALAWLKVCAHLSKPEDTECSGAYDDIYNLWIGWMLQDVDPALAVLTGAREYAHAFNNFPQGRSLLILQAIDTLLELETDSNRSQTYWHVMNTLVYPLTSYRRSPLFDVAYLDRGSLTDQEPHGFEPMDGTSTRKRIAAILGQFPAPDHIYRRDQASEGCARHHVVSGLCTSPTGGCRFAETVDYSGCDSMKNLFSQTVAPGFLGAAGVWSLGADNALIHDSYGKESYYWLGDESEAACDGNSRGGVYEPIGFDYLLPYWLGRARGVLEGP